MALQGAVPGGHGGSGARPPAGRPGRYQDAYGLLQPFETKPKDDAAFNLLLGEAALRTERAEQARTLFERSLAAQPGSVEAHLGLGRAYLALGDYGRAKIEFETVLRFDDLPADLQQQAEIYAEAALAYAEAGVLSQQAMPSSAMATTAPARGRRAAATMASSPHASAAASTTN